MKREIKFRAWSYHPVLKRGSMMPVTNESALYITDNSLFPDHTIMQFTGQYDMDGKEVYEDDIIIDGREYSDQRQYIIKWIDNDACFIGKHGNLNFSVSNWPKFAKVIGNIHETQTEKP